MILSRYNTHDNCYDGNEYKVLRIDVSPRCHVKVLACIESLLQTSAFQNKIKIECQFFYKTGGNGSWRVLIKLEWKTHNCT